MTLEQKQLLYEIAQWHNKEFYNRMEDHWSAENYTIDRKCKENITHLEKCYQYQYGDLPQWDTIDDVWAVIKELKTGLECFNNGNK